MRHGFVKIGIKCLIRSLDGLQIVSFGCIEKLFADHHHSLDNRIRSAVWVRRVQGQVQTVDHREDISEHFGSSKYLGVLDITTRSLANVLQLSSCTEQLLVHRFGLIF